MFWNDQAIPFLDVDSRDILRQQWVVGLTLHPVVKSFEPGTFTLPTGVLSRYIKTNLNSRATPYLALFKDLIDSVETVTSYVYLPHLVDGFMDVLADPVNMSAYLSQSRIDQDVLGRGLASLFEYKSYGMLRSSTVHAEFESLADQRKALSTLLVAFSKFLANSFLTEGDMSEMSEWVIDRFDIPEVFGKMRSNIRCVQLLTTPHSLCREVDIFVEAVDHFYDRFRIEKKRLSQDAVNVSDLTWEVERSILADGANLVTLFERGSLKPLQRTKMTVFVDSSRNYVFKTCDPVVENFYVCMELVVDYFICRVLEDCLPICRNFSRALCCLEDVKVNVDSIYPARATVPRLMISPMIRGFDLYKMVKQSKLDEVSMLDSLLEVFGALQEAYEVCEFTHYDLHAGNVMMEPCEPCVWKWRGYEGVVTRSVRPVVIDFGRSRVVYSGVELCRPWSPVVRDYLSIETRRPYPAHDIFRLMQSCCTSRESIKLCGIVEKMFGASARELEYSFGTAMYSLPYLDRYAHLEYKDAVECILDTLTKIEK